ncbi:hypothetical protein L7F22_014570 [Adiantum nelumboides]|nr:hypothetical protein [Adiantum nelumboides]
MGNQASSCTLGAGSAENCTSRLQAAIVQPSAVAKVLSLDGQVLHFTKSVKAIQVLLRHPNHCLCLAQSLRLSPSSASNHLSSPSSSSSSSSSSLSLPCSLLPDDELQLGSIYILLPFHTFRLFLSAAAAQSHHQRQYRALSHPSLLSSRADSSRSRSREEPTSHGEQSTTSKEAPPTSHLAHLAQPISVDDAHSMPKQRLTSANQVQSVHEAQPISSQPCSSSVQLHGASAQAHSPSKQGRKSASSTLTQRSQIPTNNYISTRRLPQIPGYMDFPTLPASSAAEPARRSFELQRPGRGAPLDIRRCRSWRPRLRVIAEVNSW